MELSTTAPEAAPRPHQPEEHVGVKVDEVEGAPTRPPPKKRRRIVISCTECHRRKQKCDRGYPCANCVSRKKEDACRYETGAPTARQVQQQSGSETHPANGDAAAKVDGGSCNIPKKVAAFGYSTTSGASTLGFLKRIDSATAGSGGGEEAQKQLAAVAAGDPGSHGDSSSTRERFKSLVRQLPARTYIEKLVDIYFQEFNFSYFPLERSHFDKQLAEWHALPFSALSTVGPQGLTPEMRAFPAVLFQIMATALLALPSGSDPTFDPLKYAGGMSFEDLAMDYSESGMSILSLLGKRQMSLNTVLTGFLRAAFLKYTALVTEAWHAIGSAIRDAQEIGLHREALDPKPRAGGDAGAVLENQWEIQHRRRLWHTLVVWDLHTAVVLGRPVSIDGEMQPPLPVDCPIPRDRSREPVRPRGEGDPPTPITRLVWSFRCMSYLRDILRLEKEGPCPRDFDKVDRLHEELLRLDEETPPYFRLENPDTRFDDHPDCYWLPAMRPVFPQLVAFNFMVLHRPFILTRKRSRSEALGACMKILQAQRVQFSQMKPEQYKTFAVFFGTFDAIVLVATIYILFPREHPELLPASLQHFQWSVERFEAMSARNNLAKAAVCVLQAIYMRLKKALGLVCRDGKCVPISETASEVNKDNAVVAVSSTEQQQQRSPSSSAGTPFLRVVTNNSHGPSAGPQTAATASAPSVAGGAGSTPATSTTAGSEDVYPVSSISTSPGRGLDWSLPSDFDWGSIQPLYATGDLVYNDLMIGDEAATVAAGGAPAAPASGTGGTGFSAELQAWAAATAGIGGGADLAVGSAAGTVDDGPAVSPAPIPGQGSLTWQFEGDFGNDSVWSLLNYAPF